MLVAIVLLHCGDCFNLLMAQHMVGVLQMVSSAGSSPFRVLKRTFGAARCRGSSSASMCSKYWSAIQWALPQWMVPLLHGCDVGDDGAGAGIW